MNPTDQKPSSKLSPAKLRELLAQGLITIDANVSESLKDDYLTQDVVALLKDLVREVEYGRIMGRP